MDSEGKEHGLVGDKITSKKIWNFLRQKTFYGFDFDSTMLRISAMNMGFTWHSKTQYKILRFHF